MKYTLLLTGLLLSMYLNAQAHSELMDKVLKNLNLEISQCYEQLLVEKVLPYSKNESIVVIPEIAVLEEQYFSLNSYILLVDNKSGDIKQQYYEDHRTNGWESDAIELSKITIDTAPYLVTDHTRAFGIRVSYIGQSRANPYWQETISLFEPRGDSLVCLLKNYEVRMERGEWDGQCEGIFEEEKKTISISKEKTNGYYDLDIANNIQHSEVELNGEDCEEKFANTSLIFSKLIFIYNNYQARFSPKGKK